LRSMEQKVQELSETINKLTGGDES
jgi:hypothetical protein